MTYQETINQGMQEGWKLRAKDWFMRKNYPSKTGISFHTGEIFKETEKAILVKYYDGSGQQYWLPKSVVEAYEIYQ